MASDNIEKLYKILDILEKSGKNKDEIDETRKLIDLGKLPEALAKIRELNNLEKQNKESKEKEASQKTTDKPKTRKRKKVKEEENDETNEDEKEDNGE